MKDSPEFAITVRGFCEESEGTNVTIGPRHSGEIVDLLREAQAHCKQVLAPRRRVGASARGPRYLCSGVFTEGPLGLILQPDDVRTLASERAALTVRLFRNVEAFRERILAVRDEKELDDYLQPAKGESPEIEVIFALRGVGLDFGVISKRLGLEPTYTSSPRRPFTSEGGSRRHQWILTTGPLRLMDFQEPLAQLFERLAPLTDQIRTLANEMLVEPSVDLVVLEYSDRIPTLRLGPNDLLLLANLESRFWLDIL